MAITPSAILSSLTTACLLGAALLAGCTNNPYILGAYAGAGGDAGMADAQSVAPDGAPASGLTFNVNLNSSGVSSLGAAIALSAGTLAPALHLRGEKAAPTGWPSEEGALLVPPPGMTPATSLGAPFSDGTRAVGISGAAAAYIAPTSDIGEVGAGDALLEVVFRAAPSAELASKQPVLAGAADGGPSAGSDAGTSAGKGWSLNIADTGSLVLSLSDGQTAVQVVSEPLIPSAWYQCRFWVSRGFGARADCNGHVGTMTDLGALGDVSSTANMTVGGSVRGSPSSAAGASALLADFWLFRAPPAALSNLDWTSIGRARFSQLTGCLPTIAVGTALPHPSVRASPAYLDLDRGDGSGRQLFLVGPDWPRVACRTDLAGSNMCGYLSERTRQRLANPQPAAWTATELKVGPASAPFADGEQTMQSLIASANSAPHLLSWAALQTYGVGQKPVQEVLSFFVRAESSHFIGASVVSSAASHGEAVFDVRAGIVVTSPAAARAAIEPWGSGLFRCSYIFVDSTGMPLTYRVHALDNLQADIFAGDGTTAQTDVTGLQLEISAAYAGSLVFSDTQAADQLTFVANDGNLPLGGPVAIRLAVLLPPGPRLTDQAIVNLNYHEMPQSQVDLFVTGDSNIFELTGLDNAATLWALPALMSAPSAVNGLRHSLGARWDAHSAGLSIDGVMSSQPTQAAGAPPLALDNIDVGFSVNSSGPLEGLVAQLRIGSM